jgi:hypothetical protein
MTNSQRLAAVRRCLDRWFETQHHDEDIDIRDAVLIRNGFYAGRRFELGQYRAVWFMEEDELKIQDASGTIVAKFNAAEINRLSGVAPDAVAPEVADHSDDERVATISMKKAVSASENAEKAESQSSAAQDQSIRRAA